MKVRYTPRARGDIERIFDYLNQRSRSGAQNVLLAIYAAVQFIAERPQASEKTQDSAIRMKVILRYRYKIFYSIVGDIIEIVHIRHASRRPWQGKR